MENYLLLWLTAIQNVSYNEDVYISNMTKEKRGIT